ncbi:MAG: hypothetical protein Q9225_007818 [Loekoesia sp. 1 TL-2023]
MADSGPGVIRLTPLDNMVRGLYVSVALYFPGNGSDVTSIKETLRSGLSKTLDALPILAGTLQVQDETPNGNLAVTAPWRAVDEILTVSHPVRTDLPDYQTLRSEHFPASYLDNDLMPSLPSSNELQMSVMLAKLNFISGGIILGICTHHSVVDGTGNAIVNGIWAAHCRGGSCSQQRISHQADRERLLKGLGEGGLDEFPDMSYLSTEEHLESTSTAAKEKAVTLPKTQTVLFYFPRSKLRELKELVSKAGKNRPGWISTIDALSCLLWCCITAARKPHAEADDKPAGDGSERKRYLEKFVAGGHLLVGDSETSEPLATLGIVMNGRRFLQPPLSADYIGNVTVSGGIAAPVTSVKPTLENVSKFAAVLRQRINSMDEKRIVRMIDAINSVPDVSRLRPNLPPDPEFCVFISSWSTQRWYDMDWGSVIGGRPERVRLYKPFPPGASGFCFVMPELPPEAQQNQDEGGLEVVVCLEEQAMTLLKADKLFNEFAQYRSAS